MGVLPSEDRGEPSGCDAGAAASLRPLPLLQGAGLGYRFIEGMVQMRTQVCQQPYGDQAIFVSRQLYNRIGGSALQGLPQRPAPAGLWP